MYAIIIASVAMATIGFYARRYLLTATLSKRYQRHLNRYYQKRYRALYNEQMQHLCDSYRQERVALVHRYESLTADLEREMSTIKGLIDHANGHKTIAVSNRNRIEFMFSEDTHSDSGWVKKVNQ